MVPHIVTPKRSSSLELLSTPSFFCIIWWRHGCFSDLPPREQKLTSRFIATVHLFSCSAARLNGICSLLGLAVEHFEAHIDDYNSRTILEYKRQKRLRPRRRGPRLRRVWAAPRLRRFGAEALQPLLNPPLRATGLTGPRGSGERGAAATQPPRPLQRVRATAPLPLRATPPLRATGP